MPTKSRKLLNTIKSYRMSPNLACKLNELSLRNNVPEAELVRDILAKFIEQSGLQESRMRNRFTETEIDHLHLLGKDACSNQKI